MFVSNINGTAFATPVRLAALETTDDSDAKYGNSQSQIRRLGLYVNAQGSFGSRDATAEVGFDADTWTVNGGADYRFTDKLTLGVAGGYASTEARLHQFRLDTGSLNVDGYNLTLYGSYYDGGWYVDAAGGFAQNEINQRRNINVVNGSGTLTGVAESIYDGWQYNFSAGTGYDFIRKGLAVGPYGRVNYLKSHLDGYTENVGATGGSDPVRVAQLGLKMGSQDIDSLITDIGGRASYTINSSGGVFVPHIQFGWEHEYENDSRYINQQFIGDPTHPFTTRTDSPDRDFFSLGAGISASFARGIMAFVDYGMPLGFRHITNHNVRGGLKFQL